MKRVLLWVAIVAAGGFVLYRATLAGAGFHCDACVRFEGREACKAATGPTREEAERAAISTACALVSRGVTSTIACQGLEPVSLTCEGR